MPVTVGGQLRPMQQDEFADVAYEVMACVFAIHSDWGRLFSEEVYKGEIARRLESVQTEVPIDVTFGDFRKSYSMDLVVRQGAVFELKTVDKLHARHQSQLLNYLLLAELPHGKLVNLRPESVQHEFVNSTLIRADRIKFSVDDSDWYATHAVDQELRRYIVALLGDLGVGLDLQLYREAISHFLGGDDFVLRDIDVVADGLWRGSQKERCARPGVGIEITSISPNNLDLYEAHLKRFLQHVSLTAIHWINITRQVVTFRTLRRDNDK